MGAVWLVAGIAIAWLGAVEIRPDASSSRATTRKKAERTRSHRSTRPRPKQASARPRGVLGKASGEARKAPGGASLPDAPDGGPRVPAGARPIETKSRSGTPDETERDRAETLSPAGKAAADPRGDRDRRTLEVGSSDNPVRVRAAAPTHASVDGAIERRATPSRPSRGARAPASNRLSDAPETVRDASRDDPRRLPGQDEPVEDRLGAVAIREAPPPLPRTLIHPPSFEHTVSVNGFVLGPEAGPLLPPHLALASHAWSPATADVRLSGLGWTEALTLDPGLVTPHWVISGRWAPPALSARPAPVGVAGTAVADGPEGMAVSAPRGAWRASGLLGGPLVQGRLGAVLSLEASGLGLPPVEPGLAAGGRSRQTLAMTTTWRPTEADRLGLLLLAGRRTESPDCFRCTDTAARVDRTLAVLAGAAWTHDFGSTVLDLRLSAEHRMESARAS